MKSIFHFFSISLLFWLSAVNENFAQRISAGGHSIFLCDDSTARGCGDNYAGQLGDGTYLIRNTPTPVNLLTGITAVSAGGFAEGAGGHTLFLRNDSTVWACGRNNIGQLGIGSITGSNVPVQISSLSQIVAISAGRTHSLFLRSDGTVWACGNNTSGQLADGTTTSSNIPVQATTLSGIIAVSAGNDHSLFLKNDGTVWASGGNYYGQLGDGTTIDRRTPIQVDSLSDIIAISAGGWHSLFLKNDGTAYACGVNGSGQLGDGTTFDKVRRVQVSSLTGITAIAAGWIHSLFLKNNGTVWGTGSNYYGQLGFGTNSSTSTPNRISSLTGIIAIAAGGIYPDKGQSLFLRSDATVWACGYNHYGQLGDGTTIDKYTPVQVQNLCSITAGINDNNLEKDFLIYPNPFSTQTTLHINAELKNAALKLNNNMGQLIKEIKHISEQNIDLQRNDLPSGIYYLQLTDDNKLIKTFKLVITD